ncbi:hypothetical protein M5689_006463 [Euphorbia peplus]|nr:hypothetical protein M5689_006463 [Euphorbia peplus]
MSDLRSASTSENIAQPILFDSDVHSSLIEQEFEDEVGISEGKIVLAVPQILLPPDPLTRLFTPLAPLNPSAREFAEFFLKIRWILG